MAKPHPFSVPDIRGDDDDTGGTITPLERWVRAESLGSGATSTAAEVAARIASTRPVGDVTAAAEMRCATCRTTSLATRLSTVGGLARRPTYLKQPGSSHPTGTTPKSRTVDAACGAACAACAAARRCYCTNRAIVTRRPIVGATGGTPRAPRSNYHPDAVSD